MLPTLLQYLGEARVLTQVRLTNHQKKILAIILMSDEKRVHDEQILGDRNMAGARDILTRLGLIENQEDDWVGITEKGEQVAEDEGLTSGGTLTDEGNAAVNSNTQAAPSGAPSTSPTAEPAADPFADGPGVGNDAGLT